MQVSITFTFHVSRLVRSSVYEDCKNSSSKLCFHIWCCSAVFFESFQRKTQVFELYILNFFGGLYVLFLLLGVFFYVSLLLLLWVLLYRDPVT